METPRPRSRRSNLDLSKLSIAPLSREATYPSALDDYADSGTPNAYHRTYIQDRSAPATPGILSRSSSTSRRPGSSGSGSNLYARAGAASSKSYTHLAFANYDESDLEAYNVAPSSRSNSQRGHIPKSKSTTVLYPPGGTLGPLSSGARTPSSAKPSKHKKTKSSATAADEGLLYRLGSAIATSNREEKGQSWLIGRASNTSLAGLERAEALARNTTRASTAADDFVGGAEYREFVPMTPGSRFSSRRNSRSGRAASELAAFTPFKAGSRTPLGARTPVGRRSTEVQADYFGSAAIARGIAGPDFVDERDRVEFEGGEPGEWGHDGAGAASESEDEWAIERGEDDEVARLASARREGLAGFVDRLVGWSFDAKDEEDEEEELEARKMEAERRRKNRGSNDAHAASLRRAQIAGAIGGGQAGDVAGAKSEHLSADKAAEGGWSDVYWLMSVASKAFFQ